jgi:hypothetical protein
MPQALVEIELILNKDPRLATAVGFLLPAPPATNKEK